MRIIQFSDTHISHLGGVGHDNAERLAGYLNQVARPDLAVNTGDIVILDPDAADDRAAAVRIHQRIEAPLRVVPGNHDVGECAADPWQGLGVTSQRVQAFRAAWGSDRFALNGTREQDAEDWLLVGLNSELCGSYLPEEGEQWTWLEQTAAAAARSGRHVLLFLHKPLVIDDGTEDGVTVTAAVRARILELFRACDLQVVANGHLHRYRSVIDDAGHTAVWAPSLSFAPEAEPTYKFGPGTAGIVEYTIAGHQIEARFVAVPGIEGVTHFSELPEIQAGMAVIEAR